MEWMGWMEWMPWILRSLLPMLGGVVLGWSLRRWSDEIIPALRMKLQEMKWGRGWNIMSRMKRSKKEDAATAA